MNLWEKETEIGLNFWDFSRRKRTVPEGEGSGCGKPGEGRKQELWAGRKEHEGFSGDCGNGPYLRALKSEPDPESLGWGGREGEK